MGDEGAEIRSPQRILMFTANQKRRLLQQARKQRESVSSTEISPQIIPISDPYAAPVDESVSNDELEEHDWMFTDILREQAAPLSLPAEIQAVYDELLAQLKEVGYEPDERPLVKFSKQYIAAARSPTQVLPEDVGEDQLRSITDRDVLEEINVQQVMLDQSAPECGQVFIYYIYMPEPGAKTHTWVGVSMNPFKDLESHNNGEQRDTLSALTGNHKWEMGAIVGPWKFPREAERVVEFLRKKKRGMKSRHETLLQIGLRNGKARYSRDMETEIMPRFEAMRKSKKQQARVRNKAKAKYNRPKRVVKKMK